MSNQTNQHQEISAGDFLAEHQPILQNRFRCHIVEAPQVEPFLVQKVKLPKLTKGKWSSLEIEYLRVEKLDMIGTFADIASVDTMKPLTVEVHELTPEGNVEATYCFEKANLVGIELPTLDYGTDDLSKVKLVFENFKLNYVTEKTQKKIIN